MVVWQKSVPESDWLFILRYGVMVSASDFGSDSLGSSPDTSTNA